MEDSEFMGNDSAMEIRNPTLLELMVDDPDPRVENWLMMDGAGKTYIAVFGYVLLVKLILPAYMKNREPYQLKSFMMLYNVFLVGLSLWMSVQFASYWFTGRYSWQCEPVDYSNNEDALKILFVAYVYFMSKFVEFADTVVFVLRKKYNQVTGLHVYHHLTTVIFTYNCVKCGGGGYNTFYMMLNSFVHVWMYLYYALAGLGPNVQKYLWWKRYITQLQLLQFLAVAVFLTQAWLFGPKSCRFSKYQAFPVLFMALHFLYLFKKFYNRSYTKVE